MVVFTHFGSCELSRLLDFGYFLVPEADDYIFRLEVGMYDLAHPVNVVKANEALACEFAHKWQRHTFIVVSFDDLEEVHTQNLEHHNKVLSVWTVMDERVEQLCTV